MERDASFDLYGIRIPKGRWDRRHSLRGHAAGDGQATISKVVRDTTARQMTREKLLLLAELLQNGVPDSNGERRKLRHVEILVYTTDQAFWDDLRIQADAEMTNSPQQSRNSDVCAQIIRQCRDNGCRLRNMGNSLLQKLVRSEAYRYLENQEVSPNDGTGKIA